MVPLVTACMKERLFQIGFIVLALVLIAVVVLAVLPMFWRRYAQGDHSHQKQRVDITTIQSALVAYASEHDGYYPDTLDPLFVPDENGRRYLSGGPHPRDPWNREYLYIRGEPPNVISFGRDGVPGGEGEDADVDYLRIAAGQ